jgi:hypothetical protein
MLGCTGVAAQLVASRVVLSYTEFVIEVVYTYIYVRVVYVKIQVFKTALQHPVALCRFGFNFTFSVYTAASIHVNSSSLCKYTLHISG